MAELQRALTDPSAEVAPQYWLWRATLTDGTALRGRRLNEDSFSVQVLDSAGRLRGLPKSQIERQELSERSPMPSFAKTLTDAQRNDIAAYLATLQ